MKIIYLLPCVLFFNIYTSDTSEITENLGNFYSNNPSARASQSRLNAQESQIIEIENVCNQCDKEISRSKIICNFCAIKKKIKSLAQKLFTSSTPKDTKKVRQSTYKKETNDSLLYFLRHNISWTK